MKHQPQTLLALVEQQIGRWNQAARPRDGEGPRPWPVITISREYGARGTEVAQIVARRLEFEVWDQEIVHAIAEHAELPERLWGTLDEHRRNALSEVVNAFVHVRRPGAERYLSEICRVVHTLSEHGRAVIVGRGAQYVLDPGDAFRVRVLGDEIRRATGLAERKGIPVDAALREVRENDLDRRAFIRQYFGRDVNDPRDYDLLVNATSLGVEGSAEVIVRGYAAFLESRADAEAHRAALLRSRYSPIAR